MIDLKERRNFLTEAQTYQLAIAKLERLWDASNINIGMYRNFIATFKNRYPSEYQDIIQEYNQRNEPFKEPA